ncbi:response regulator [Spirosoma sp. HMF3257]|uniref:Response regulator n=1 Tax=Spirosoma telluris TaxID=2183553 RepID=A0A327NHB0_9BACT|nr:response regulator [Spirosoma telluris]RAI74770.1 response regulator [Spirosoma telluris]
MNNYSNPLIYVVDDDHDEHDLLKSIFASQHANCDLKCFSDGTELLTQLTHRIDHRLPDLILLDLQMPILSGYDILRLLKRDADWKHIPIIVYSTSASPLNIYRCNQLGCSAFIIKTNDYLKKNERLLSSFINVNLHLI